MKPYLVLLLLMMTAKGSPRETSEEVKMEFRMKTVEEWDEDQVKADEIEFRNNIMLAIMCVESNNKPSAHNIKEDAVSLLQIRKCVIDDLNRINGYAKYSYEDRWSRDKSIQIFWEYQNYWNNNINIESCSRIWNGGPRGESKLSTEGYYTKVLYKFLIS